MIITIFNNLNDNTAKPVECSWQELTDLLSSPDIRDLKDGALFSGAQFDNNRRGKANAKDTSVLLLDFDHDETIVLNKWDNLNVAYFYYTSFSHGTPEKPCAYRVVIPLLKPIPASSYQFLFEWVKDYSPSIDAKCKDISRIMYLPSCPVERHELFRCGGETSRGFLNWETLIEPYKIQWEINNLIYQARQKISQKSIHTGEYKRYIEVVLRNMETQLSDSKVGARNDNLNKIAYTLGQLAASNWSGLTYMGVESFLMLHASNLNLTPHELKTTIKSGLTSGFKTPIPPPNSEYSLQNLGLPDVIRGIDKLPLVRDSVVYVGILSNQCEPYANYIHFNVGITFEVIDSILKTKCPQKKVVFIVPFNNSHYHRKLLTKIAKAGYNLCIESPDLTQDFNTFKTWVLANSDRGMRLELFLSDKYKNSPQL